jgi:hypothetical protein
LLAADYFISAMASLTTAADHFVFGATNINFGAATDLLSAIASFATIADYFVAIHIS